MARLPISEFRAKTLLYEALGQTFAGISLDAQAKWGAALATLPANGRYVAKVDEGVKGRFKKGLVKLNLATDELSDAVKDLFAAGYRYVLVEPYQTHEAAAERYFMLNRTREGLTLMYNRRGGVDVENNGPMEHITYSATAALAVEQALGLAEGTIAKLVAVFESAQFGFLEINPLIIDGDTPRLLDAAVEVDGEAAALVAGRWSLADVRSHARRTPQEEAIAALAASSQSSFNLQVLNPNGQIFLLLSGGGASVTLADEVHNQGYGKQLANYGEYSGNPTADETYVYTKQLLSLLLESSANRKVLVIGGGVANFTDIRTTFKGVIKALKEVESQLQSQHLKVFVRRGGPYEAEGLAAMQHHLASAGLLGVVAGPGMMLSEIIPLALDSLKEGAAA